MTQTVCNNFFHVLCLQPDTFSLTPTSLPGGVWWQNSGVGELYVMPTLATVLRAQFGPILSPGPFAQCFLHLMHISSVSMIQHSQPLILPLELSSIHHPSLKVKSYIYCITSSLTHDLMYLLNWPVTRIVIAFISALGRKRYRFWVICATLFFTRPFIFSTRFVTSQDFFKNAYITLLQKQVNKK